MEQITILSLFLNNVGTWTVEIQKNTHKEKEKETKRKRKKPRGTWSCFGSNGKSSRALVDQ